MSNQLLFFLTATFYFETIDECLLDTDLDRNPNIFDEDDDNDNVLDVNDFCPAGQIDWISGFVNDKKYNRKYQLDYFNIPCRKLNSIECKQQSSRVRRSLQKITNFFLPLRSKRY